MQHQVLDRVPANAEVNPVYNRNRSTNSSRSSSSMHFSRSQSAKVPVENNGGAAERFASRPSSRLKSRNGEVESLGAADLGDLEDDALMREGRTTKRRVGGGAAARRNGGEIWDLDASEYGGGGGPIIERTISSKSLSRLKGRSSRHGAMEEEDFAPGLLQQEGFRDDFHGNSSIVSRSRNGMDMADMMMEDGHLYGLRSQHSTPRLQITTSMDPQEETTTTSRRSNRSAKGTQDEELRAFQEVVLVKEVRKSSSARSSSIARVGESADDLIVVGQEEKINLQASAKPTRASQRELKELTEERLSLKAERHHHARKQQRSPRKHKHDDNTTDIQLMNTERMGASSEHITRRHARSPQVSREELEHSDDYEEGGIAAAAAQRRSRPDRQQKHKVHDPPPPQEPMPMLPVSHHPSECEPHEVPATTIQQPLEPTPLCWPTSTMPTREADPSPYAGWLQATADLIMWRDIPRSALWFGAGSFIILSGSYMPTIQCGMVGVGANLALVYLAAVFFHRTFVPGSAAELSEDINEGYCTTEADIVRWIHTFLPAVNLALEKARQIFSGDPATTLKVAAVLWLFTRAGSSMSLWSFVRLCYFVLFTVPKCFACYSNQLYAHGWSIAARAWMVWDTYSYKKAVVVAAFLLAWNISSFSTRLWGGFMIFVWLRLYQQSHPLAFQGAAPEVRSTINLSDHQDTLQQAMEEPKEGRLTVPSTKYDAFLQQLCTISGKAR
ncbi:unnamed protein product [Sphagnum troendelagicum]|uniref:Reticulon-like protein n=1 Tax=Sphagnum troendelagicum TaxID=128251 RepID=A0ABP0UP63_9BRYO